jgi:mRNA-degrading endonuclease toxin of MazEF toxin-antitoxin module
MNVRRGDVVLVLYPFASGRGASRRPALIVQNDRDNRRLDNTIIAQITTNVRHGNDPTQLLIPWGTPEGQQAGLLHDSVVSCNPGSRRVLKLGESRDPKGRFRLHDDWQRAAVSGHHA